MEGFNYVCGLCNRPKWGVSIIEIAAIIIATLSLIATVRAVFVAKDTQTKNEAYLRYSYWLNEKHKTINNLRSGTLTKIEKAVLKQTAMEALIIVKKFGIEFPDPATWKDFNKYWPDEEIDRQWHL